MRYLELISADERVLYYVESRWPSSEFGKPANHTPPEQVKWVRHNSSAWNDKRAPNTKRDGFLMCRGSFDEQNPDVAEVPSRVRVYRSDAPVFTDLDAAFAYAERLREFGECAYRYGGSGTQEDRDAQYADRPIYTRVVRQYSKLTEWEVAR